MSNQRMKQILHVLRARYAVDWQNNGVMLLFRWPTWLTWAMLRKMEEAGLVKNKINQGDYNHMDTFLMQAKGE